MKTSTDPFEVGDIVSYHEDGGICLCEILKYKRVYPWEEVTLKIVEVIVNPSLGGPYAVGETYKVDHRIDIGFAGDWHIFHEGEQVRRKEA